MGVAGKSEIPFIYAKLEFSFAVLNLTNIFSNDVQSRHWADGDMNFPPSKSQGRTVMTSDFMEPVNGFLQYDSLIWNELKVS